MSLSYQQAGLVLKRPGTGATDAQIRDLQRHLRALGYLRRGIDGGLRGRHRRRRQGPAERPPSRNRTDLVVLAADPGARRDLGRATGCPARGGRGR